LFAAVAMAATACSSGSTPAATLRVLPGAFGPGVFVTSVTGDGHGGWATVGWSTGADGQPATACFFSHDATSWQACPLHAVDTDGHHTRLLGVAHLGSKLIAGGVAVGALHGNLRPYLWTGTPDRLDELNLARELFGGERIITFDGLAAGPLGGFAVGTWDGVTHQSVAQVWRSDDGTDWRRLDGVASLTSTSDELLRGRAVAVGARRVTVVGAAINLHRPADRDDGAVWWSDDGTTWTRAGVAAAHMGGAGDQELMTVVALADGGFSAGGSDGNEAAVWSSPDGAVWRRADPLPSARGTGATVTALAQGPKGGQWAAGVVDGTPRLWRSSDGRQWSARRLPKALLAAGPAQSVVLASGSGQVLLVVRGTKGSTAAVV
jgi:hypothetical protein